MPLIRLWFVPAPPRLLKAAMAASNASPVSGLDAVAEVVGVMIPTFTTGPVAAVDCTAAPAASSEIANNAMHTAMTSHRVRRVPRSCPRTYTEVPPLHHPIPELPRRRYLAPRRVPGRA